MANLRDIPNDLKQVQEEYIRLIDSLSFRMATGEITIAEWLAEMADLMPAMMTEAMETGKNGRLLATQERLSDRLAAVQVEFLANFAQDITANGWLPAYTERAKQYATSSTQAYAQGDVIRQAGRTIPLPAMPAEGTICHSNCGCRWRIVVIDEGKGDFDGYWELHKTHNCQTCIQRAIEWSPVEIRNNTLL